LKRDGTRKTPNLEATTTVEICFWKFDAKAARQQREDRTVIGVLLAAVLSWEYIFLISFLLGVWKPGKRSGGLPYDSGRSRKAMN
jgi:hypothetical protein